MAGTQPPTQQQAAMALLQLWLRVGASEGEMMQAMICNLCGKSYLGDGGVPCPDCWGHPRLAEGRKDDGDKPRYDLIPPSTLHALATVLTFGAKKYAPRNWEKGISWGRVFAALMRHLWAWWGGELYDPETGFSHLWHAQCCLSFLIEFETTHANLDDRPARS